RRFREEFGAEMEAVFAARLRETQDKQASLAHICLLEAGGLLAGLLREHAAALSERTQQMKHNTSTALVLVLSGLLLLTRRPVASYFCNLADPTGGGLGNHVACGIYFQQAGSGLVTALGHLVLAAALLLIVRTTLLRRRTR
ncbi:MAG: hypothetical protein M3N47_13010, partial [Chloroflexota bacterium]|nr:hypothetical protein [Chloroflexota bacterium]